MRLLDRIEDVARAPGRNAKLSKLRLHANDTFKEAVRLALDPYIRFWVRKVPDVPPANKSKLSWPQVFTELDRLARREVTGNEALAVIMNVMARLDAADQEVVRRILRKDLRCGVNSKTANAAIEGWVRTFEVQLAAPLSEQHCTWPMIAEPKIDGMRAVAIVVGGEVEWLSRGGRPIHTLDHISPVLVACNTDMVLDGEAATGGAFEQSMSAVKRGSPKQGVPAEFYAFDCLTIREWTERTDVPGLLERRARLTHLVGRHPNLHVTPQVEVASMAAAREFYEEQRAAGLEGAILKNMGGTYAWKRTRDWMKMKPSDTIDVVITGVKEGTGKYKGMLGAFTFDYFGTECSAGSGFSDEQREDYWRRRHDIIGDEMEIEFTEQTGKGRTRHARFIRMRTHDGERS